MTYGHHRFNLEWHRLFSLLGWAIRPTRFRQATRSCGSLHISFELSPSIHLHHPTTAFLVIVSPQLYRASWCLIGFFSLSPRPNHLSFLFLERSPAACQTTQFALQHSSVSPRWAYAWCNAPATVFCSNVLKKAHVK